MKKPSKGITLALAAYRRELRKGIAMLKAMKPMHGPPPRAAKKGRHRR
jgi:hypothetical protein